MYTWPYVTTFDSVEELPALLGGLNLRNISTHMLAWHKDKRVQVARVWDEIVVAAAAAAAAAAAGDGCMQGGSLKPNLNDALECAYGPGARINLTECDGV
jgi:hypothetical protein